MLKKLSQSIFSLKSRKSIKLALAIFTVILVFGILSGLIVTQVQSLFQASNTISSIGTFKAIGIDAYWDDALTNKVTRIDWGSLIPGAKKTYTIYISNEGNLPLTLELTTANWSPPSVSNQLNLAWDVINGQTINAGDAVPVTLTLTVSPSVSVSGSFSFDITAVGTA